MRLCPRRFERSLYSLYSDLAQLLVNSAEMLSRTLGQPTRDRSRILPRLHENATRASELTHRISNRLAESLITPFEAEVLYDFAHSLDDAVSRMELTAEMTVAYRVGSISKQLLETAQAIERGAEITLEATWTLSSLRRLGEYHREMHHLRRHGDRLVHQAVAALYTQGGAATDLLRHRDIATGLGSCLELLDAASRHADLLRVRDT